MLWNIGELNNEIIALCKKWGFDTDKFVLFLKRKDNYPVIITNDIFQLIETSTGKKIIKLFKEHSKNM